MKASDRKDGTMPSVSGYASRSAWEAACWEKLLSTYSAWLPLLITARERHHLVVRAVALDRLMAGKSYKQIGDELWLSPQTISGIKKMLKEKRYRSYFERSKGTRVKREHSPLFPAPRPRPRGAPHRTKYGTVYLP